MKRGKGVREGTGPGGERGGKNEGKRPIALTIAQGVLQRLSRRSRDSIAFNRLRGAAEDPGQNGKSY